MFDNVFKSLKTCDYAYGSKKVIKSQWPMLCVATPKLKLICKEAITNNPNLLSGTFQPKTYEDVMCFGLCVVYSKLNLDEKIIQFENYFNFVDNWAFIDSVFMSLKVKQNERERLRQWIEFLAGSQGEYLRRSAVILCMKNFFTSDTIENTIKIFRSIKTGEYFVDMALAWAYAEMLIKQPDIAIQEIKQKSLPRFIQNKAIQKARESYRISEQTKQELLKYKI